MNKLIKQYAIDEVPDDWKLQGKKTYVVIALKKIADGVYF